jgi:Insecticide toxin TcdB middle/N-terminal region/Insecticide toxin TcdB middle/C-terminal region
MTTGVEAGGRRLELNLRLSTADIDGSGTDDLLYVMRDRVLVWRNRSGNGFAPPYKVPLPVRTSVPEQITIVDLRGDGLPSLLVASLGGEPQHWGGVFNGGTQPYLLARIRNNLGATWTINYACTTRYWLDDQREGCAWLTSLPFPIQVVSRVECQDAISGTKAVSTFRYRHGYFDGHERAFRGFGYVERQDGDIEYVTMAAPRTRPEVEARASSVPPLLTRTWFHNGAWLVDPPLETRLRAEGFGGDPAAYAMPSGDFDWNGAMEIDGETQRQAVAAFQGQAIRVEQYALDGSAEAALPYRVTDTAYRVRLVKDRGEGPYAALLVHERESMTYEYERVPSDPMMHHGFVITIDPYGSVELDASVAYGRRPRMGETYPEQLVTHVTARAERFITLDDDATFLTGLPAEHIDWNVLGAAPAAGRYFTWDEIVKTVVAAIDARSPAARVLGREQLFYYAADAVTPAPLGASGPQALPRTRRVAMFGAAEARALYAPVLDDNALTALLEAAGYALDAEAAQWWMTDSIATYAPSGFFLPAAATTPFGATIAYTYDATGVALLETLLKARGVLDQQSSVQHFDYEALQPVSLRDANDRTHEVQLDALAKVVVTSFTGRSSASP